TADRQRRRQRTSRYAEGEEVSTHRALTSRSPGAPGRRWRPTTQLAARLGHLCLHRLQYPDLGRGRAVAVADAELAQLLGVARQRRVVHRQREARNAALPDRVGDALHGREHLRMVRRAGDAEGAW